MYGLCRRKSIKLLGFVVLIIFVDQLSKFFVSDGLPLEEGGFLQKTCNPDIAWGIPLNGTLFYIVWTLALLFMIFLAKTNDWNIYLIMVIAGAISNIIDRIRFGCVIDFISLNKFPVFNLADTFITLGIFFCIISILKPKKQIKDGC